MRKSAPSGEPVRIPIYDPSLPGFKQTEIVSSGDPLSLTPSQYTLKQNLREDTRCLMARLPDALIGSATAPSATIRGFWSGAVQGTYYVVAAFDLGAFVLGSAGVAGTGGCAVYTFNVSTGAFTEITDPGVNGTPSTWGGDTNGKTRFTHNTADVNFTIGTTPRRVVNGTVVPPVDVLVFNNYQDYPLVWNPAAAASVRVVQINDIPLPAGALQFQGIASLPAFLLVATTAATRTYANSTAARYKAQDSTTAPYNATGKVCIDMVLTNLAAAGDTIKISGWTQSFAGEQICFIVQGASADVLDFFVNSTAEISSNNVDFYSFHDQSSSNPALTQVPFMQPFDSSTGNRWLIMFPLANIAAANRTCNYLRFTRRGSAPSAGYTISILAIAGTGVGGGFYGGTEFTAVYTDRFSFSESAPAVMAGTVGNLLANIGGPSLVTAGAGTSSGSILPIYGPILYEYTLTPPNLPTKVISGGLSGTPSSIDIYFRNPSTETTALFLTSIDIYDGTTSAGHQWTMQSRWLSGGNPLGVLPIDSYQWFPGAFGHGTDRVGRDPGYPPPSAFNVSLPRCGTMHTANGRIFVGSVKDSSGNAIPTDLYMSRRQFPFRFQSIQSFFSDGTADEASGTRVVFDGETIQRIISSAASYAGASKVYVLTDQNLWVLGHTSPYVISTGTGASELSLRERISADGTLEPRSVAEFNGTLMWVNQFGQLMRFGAGQPPAPVSYLRFDDIFANIPASRRGKICGAIWKFRYYFAYTPSGTTNTKVGVYNLRTGVLESIDTVSGAAERMAVCYDSSQPGSGQRLIYLGGSNQQVYGYEEGTGTIAVRIISRDITGEQLGIAAGVGYIVDQVELVHDTDTGNSAVVAIHPEQGSTYTYTSSLSGSGSVQWIVNENCDVAATASRAEYVDYQATVTGGKKLRELAVQVSTSALDLRHQ